ncbi:MAG: lysine--tRNA ligase [Candidatus Magasanikbacteria bacterium]|nr:lysine--tRNA ligase [Candidatus Magasanikbacteria bacterium]
MKTDEAAIRLQKLKELKKAGINPFPSWGEKHLSISALLGDFERLSEREETVRIAGRLRSIRSHGGSAFANLQDGTGKMQIYFKKDELGKDVYDLFVNLIDIGDFVTVAGPLFATKRGERTLLVKEWKLLAKSLLPLPDKFHGLTEVELRYRQRYLDLLANPEARALAERRIKIVQAIRDFFNMEGFQEVETPILQPLYGGAAAKPFVTHHNALDTDLYLRIAPELYLKRLLVGGFEKVFEVARCFRNEGIDFSHHPEFTQIEFYWAYATYEDLMRLMEKFFSYLLPRLGLAMKFEYQGQTVDFTPPYPRKTFRELLIEMARIDIEDYPDDKSLCAWAKKQKLEAEESSGRGRLLDDIYKHLVRPKIIQPLFMIDHPVELSPLAKRKADNPAYTERLQLLAAGGLELCNAFSELNDPLEQEARLKEQEKLRERGDEEAQRYDEDFVTALKHGMPPTAGLGMGIDRLAALLTNSHNIKEVILFPTLKPDL